jgi:hypothetical protein
MSLTDEQIAQKIRYGALYIVLFLCLFTLSALTLPILDLKYPLAFFVFPLVIASCFYFMFLNIKYPKGMKEFLKQYLGNKK